MKQNTLVCQFASPLDVDTHNKPEVSHSLGESEIYPSSVHSVLPIYLATHSSCQYIL